MRDLVAEPIKLVNKCEPNVFKPVAARLARVPRKLYLAGTESLSS
jgi:hypothetical protein